MVLKVAFLDWVFLEGLRFVDLWICLPVVFVDLRLFSIWFI